MKAEDILVKHLVAYYQYPESLAKRHASVIVEFLIQDGIDNYIDAGVISEGLYQETEDWETPDYMNENIKEYVKLELPFPNLDFQEKKIKEWIKREIKLIKKFNN